MYVELIDRLRCLNPHEDGWLVATATHTVDRHIVTGTLGCPVCGAEFEIREGAACFGGSEVEPAGAPAPLVPDALIRLAAMLGLDERPGLYVLDAAWSPFAAGFSAMAPEVRLVVLSPSRSEGAGAVLRGTGEAIPLASGCARGVALGRGGSALVEAAARVLASGGRLVAPAAAEVPRAVAILARDDACWVGERQPIPAVSAPVTPRRAVPRTGSR